MILDPAETLGAEERRQLQWQRLRQTLERVQAYVEPLRDKWQQAGVKAEDVRTWEDFTQLPLMSKVDLREHYPTGLFGKGAMVARIQGSSGTKGKPTLVGYSRHDLQVWADCVARCLAMAGAKPGQLLHNAYGYGLFTGGLGLHQGAERLGLSVLPMSGGQTQRQITLLLDLHPQGIACTPSYLANLVQTMEEEGYDPSSLGLRWAILGAEPWSESLRRSLEEALGADCVDIYGLSEVIGPGVSCECREAKNGLHIQEDHFLVEVLDPVTHAPLPPGKVGELCFTTLTREVSPVVRYRTGDLASLDPEPCLCGRTTVRMSRVLGRVDDMLVVRGVNVFPSEVEEALLGVPGLLPNWRLVLRRERALDELEVEVEADPPTEELTRRAEHALRERLGVRVSVTLRPRGHLPRSEGKAARVVDLRPKEQVRP